MSATQSNHGDRKRRERRELVFPVAEAGCEIEYGQPVPVADGVLQVRIPMPMSLAHINVYLLRDVDGWWLVDTGLDTKESKDCLRSVLEHSSLLEGLPLKALICTHFHFDHAGLAYWLTDRFDVPLYASYCTYWSLRALTGKRDKALGKTQKRFYMRTGMAADRVDSMLDAMAHYPDNPPCPDAFHRLRQGDILTIGSRRWQVLIGEGHAPEHVCLYAPDAHLLVSGDQVLPDISSNVMVGPIEPEADPMSDWLASLDRLDALDEATLVMPAHGDVFRNLSGRLQQLRNHHERQFDTLRALADADQGFTAHEAMLALFPRKLDAVQTIMALGEAIAHLTWLCKHADLARVLENGVYRYRRTA